MVRDCQVDFEFDVHALMNYLENFPARHVRSLTVVGWLLRRLPIVVGKDWELSANDCQ